MEPRLRRNRFDVALEILGDVPGLAAYRAELERMKREMKAKTQGKNANSARSRAVSVANSFFIVRFLLCTMCFNFASG